MLHATVINHLQVVLADSKAKAIVLRPLWNELVKAAMNFHKIVTLPTLNATIGEQRDKRHQPEALEAEAQFKDALSKLRAEGVRIQGFDTADICAAVVEIFKPAR